jgi:hypothetical protein
MRSNVTAPVATRTSTAPLSAPENVTPTRLPGQGLAGTFASTTRPLSSVAVGASPKVPFRP